MFTRKLQIDVPENYQTDGITFHDLVRIYEFADRCIYLTLGLSSSSNYKSPVYRSSKFFYPKESLGKKIKKTSLEYINEKLYERYVQTNEVSRIEFIYYRSTFVLIIASDKYMFDTTADLAKSHLDAFREKRDNSMIINILSEVGSPIFVVLVCILCVILTIAFK